MSDLTRNQSLVLDALRSECQPTAAYTLLDTLREHGFKAPLQVYRALDKLIELGHVHKLESLNAFVACQHDGCGLHSTTAFLICTHCQAVIECDNARMQRAVKASAKESGFSVHRSVIEVTGCCADCCDQ